MPATLYEMLGVSPEASVDEIKAALRRLIRTCYTENLAGERAAEESLLLINRARTLLTDPARRAAYDAEIAQAAGEAGSVAPSDSEIETLLAAVAAVRAPARESATTDNTGNPEPRDPGLKPSPDGRKSPHKPEARHAAPRQHKQRPAFSGTGFAAGLKAALKDLSFPGFKKRALQRDSAPRPWPRFLARLIDYGVWGILLGLALGIAQACGWIAGDRVRLLAHPLVAPILISLSWIAPETLLLYRLGTTPGKWLLNIQLRFNVSDPYVPNTPAFRLRVIFQRCLRVWVHGLAGGIFLLYFVALDKSRGYLERFRETLWDFDGDCLVTHSRLAPLAGVCTLLLAGVLGWLYNAAWQTPIRESIVLAQKQLDYAVAALVASPGLPPPSAAAAPAAPRTAPEDHSVELAATAQTFSKARSWKALARHCDEWSKARQYDAPAWHCLGRAQYELGNYGKAVGALKRAARLDPINEQIRSDLRNSAYAEMNIRQLRRRTPDEETAVAKEEPIRSEAAEEQ